jgi:hypothetical protein
MRRLIYILIILGSIGCHGQSVNINNILNKSISIELPVDFKKLSIIIGDSLQQKLKTELSNSSYFLIVNGKKLSNKPISFREAKLIGRVNFSSSYSCAILRIDYNSDEVIFYLCSFNRDGKLLSALKIIDRGNIPNVSSIISREHVINIRKEYEDHNEYYDFIIQNDGIFERTSYSEEKL